MSHFCAINFLNKDPVILFCKEQQEVVVQMSATWRPLGSSEMVSGQHYRAESRGRKSDDMTVKKRSQRRVTVTPLDEFLRSPPEGFAVEVLGTSGYRVCSDPERSLVLIDDLSSCGTRVFFRNSLGR